MRVVLYWNSSSHLGYFILRNFQTFHKFNLKSITAAHNPPPEFHILGSLRHELVLSSI